MRIFLIFSLFFSANAFAKQKCEKYEVTQATYFATLNDYLFPANDAAQVKADRFLNFLQASDIDLTGMKISSSPLKITDRGVHLLAVIEKDGKMTCKTLRVSLRKKCDSIGLEYYGKARLSDEPIAMALMDDMTAELCGASLN